MLDRYDPLKAEEIRKQRENDAEKVARKNADEVYAAIKNHGLVRSTHNSGNLFEGTIVRSIVNSSLVQLVAFWGVGDKSQPDQHDLKLMNDFQAIREKLRSHDLTDKIFILLADEHGKNNGFVDASGQLNVGSMNYLSAINHQAQALGMQSVWLSELYAEFRLSLPDRSEPITPESEAYQVFMAPGAHAEHRREQWLEAARKHNKNGNDPQQEVLYYIQMRLNERQMLQDAFPEGILMVNGSKDAKPLLPQNMPHLYLRTPPPWFQIET